MMLPHFAPEPLEQKKAFTVDEYHQLLYTGILAENSHTELIRGEIFHMSPIGSHHAGCTNRLNLHFIQRLSEVATIHVQNPVILNKTTEVQPDIAVLKKRADFYATAHPTPEDVLLIVEIADSSLGYDKKIKLPLYAESGIQEVWLVNLSEDCVEVYTEPSEPGYETRRTFRRKKAIVSMAFPEIGLTAEEIVGPGGAIPKQFI